LQQDSIGSPLVLASEKVDTDDAGFTNLLSRENLLNCSTGPGVLDYQHMVQKAHRRMGQPVHHRKKPPHGPTALGKEENGSSQLDVCLKQRSIMLRLASAIASNATIGLWQPTCAHAEACHVSAYKQRATLLLLTRGLPPQDTKIQMHNVMDQNDSALPVFFSLKYPTYLIISFGFSPGVRF
jgi:hypothetical protein